MLARNIYKKIFIGAILGAIFLTISPSKIWAQVKINEFVVQPDPEWVEFYNASNSAEFLKNYYLDDDSNFNDDVGSRPKKLLTSLNTSNSTYPYLEVNSFLNNSGGDWVVLFDAQGNTVDSYHYDSSPGDNISIGRSPNGSGNFAVLETTTKGQANSGPQLSPTPSPTPSPEPESEPDSTPSPSPTPTPVVVASPKVSPKTSTKKPVTTSLFDSHDSEEMLLSTEGGEILGSTEEEEASESGKEKSPYLIPIILGVLGLGLIGGTGVVFYKQRGYNGKDEQDGEI